MLKSHFFVFLFVLVASTARATPEMSGATYEVRMRNIAAHVDEDKEAVRRNRVRLALLSDSLVGGNGTATAEISFHNDVTSDFLLVRAVVELDGAVRYDKRDDDGGALAAVRSVPIFKGSLAAGEHTLHVALAYRANGFGVFAYMRGYRVEVKTARTFTASATSPVKVVFSGAQHGGATTPIGDRVAVQWHVEGGTTPPVATSTSTATPAAGVDRADADASILASLEAALAPYGSWVEDTVLGHVWVPNRTIVGPRFIPYVTGGHWTYEGVSGVGGDFAWISDWDWGWAPFHLGRWAVGSSGWSWIPGRAYATSWVIWRVDQQANGNAAVGWAPRPPDWAWRGGAAVVTAPQKPTFVYVRANDVFSTNLPTRALGDATLDGRTHVVDKTPAPNAMGVTVTVVTTPIGEASLAKAREFSTTGRLANATAVATADTTQATPTPTPPTVTIDTADADPSVLADVRDQLSPFGTWSEDATYGTVWTPLPQTAGGDFTPYGTAGHWTHDSTDYTWVSDYAWGWIAFHYGRWVRVGTRWSWIPGRTFRGAWVTWTTDASGAVGWAPTSPTFAWRAGVAVAVAAPPPVFVYVRANDLFALDVGARRLGGEHVAQTVVVRGPPPESLHITTTAVRRTPPNDPGLARARAGLHVTLPTSPRVTVPVTVTPPQPPRVQPRVNVQVTPPVPSATTTTTSRPARRTPPRR